MTPFSWYMDYILNNAVTKKTNEWMCIPHNLVILSISVNIPVCAERPETTLQMLLWHYWSLQRQETRQMPSKSWGMGPGRLRSKASTCSQDKQQLLETCLPKMQGCSGEWKVLQSNLSRVEGSKSTHPEAKTAPISTPPQAQTMAPREVTASKNPLQTPFPKPFTYAVDPLNPIALHR